MRRRRRRIGGALLIILAIIIMQLPVGLVEAADSTDFALEGMSLFSYKGSARSVSVPAGVEVIGERAFENNRTLEKVVFPGSLRRIDAYAFWGCDNLTDITFGKGLKEISDYSFTNCKGLKSVTVPSNITYIGIQAFADCVNLTDITIPASVAFIHESAFDGCKKLVIHCQEGTYASRYAKDFYRRQAEFAEYEDVTDFQPSTEEDGLSAPPDQTGAQTDDTGLLGATSVVGNHAVLLIDNKKPTVLQGLLPQEPPFDPAGHRPAKYRIVDAVCVADQAYYRDQDLKEIILPDGIKEIGEFAFARSKAAVLSVPDGVETISYGAFYHCDDLGTVSLPDTVETVAPKAFAHTLWVEAFSQGALPEVQGDYLISGGVLVAYRGEGKEVQIPEGVRVIAAECFQGCEQIEKLLLPTGLKTIGEGAFEGCRALREVVWNADLQKISDRAFAGCALQKVLLGNSVKELGVGAFDAKVAVTCQSKEVQAVYEVSAQRLSNADYRKPLWKETQSAPQGSVLVLSESGMSGVGAVLAGADRPYTLRLERDQSAQAAARAGAAFARNLKSALPKEAVCLACSFSDSSGISITKLGKQTLTITMPALAEFGDQKIFLYQYDRNGQLEELEVSYEKSAEQVSWRLELSKVSDLIVVPAGEKLSESDLRSTGQAPSAQLQEIGEGAAEQEVMQTALSQGSTAGSSVTPLMAVKWAVGAVLLLAGLVLALSKVR